MSFNDNQCLLERNNVCRLFYFILFYSNWFNNSIIAERQIQQTQSQALSAELIAKRTKRHLDELEVSQYYYISSLIVLLTQPFSRDPIMLNLE